MPLIYVDTNDLRYPNVNKVPKQYFNWQNLLPVVVFHFSLQLVTDNPQISLNIQFRVN